MTISKCVTKVPTLANVQDSGCFAPAEVCERLRSLFNEHPVQVPPRGNVFSGYVFVGIMPGKQGYFEGIETFQFGRTSNFLLECLREVNLFPYLTNFYKGWDAKFDESLFLINKELEILKDYVHTIVFLGKYKEYDSVNTLNKNVYRMNHPTWAKRFNKKSLFMSQLYEVLGSSGNKTLKVC